MPAPAALKINKNSGAAAPPVRKQTMIVVNIMHEFSVKQNIGIEVLTIRDTHYISAKAVGFLTCWMLPKIVEVFQDDLEDYVFMFNGRKIDYIILPAAGDKDRTLTMVQSGYEKNHTIRITIEPALDFDAICKLMNDRGIRKNES
jgi:hypothetical protein